MKKSARRAGSLLRAAAALLLTLALVLSGRPLPARADYKKDLSFEPVLTRDGENAVLEIRALEEMQLSGLAGVLTWDREVFSVADVKAADDYSLTFGESTGQAMADSAFAPVLKKGEAVLTFTFRVLKETPGTYAFTYEIKEAFGFDLEDFAWVKTDPKPVLKTEITLDGTTPTQAPTSPAESTAPETEEGRTREETKPGESEKETERETEKETQPGETETGEEPSGAAYALTFRDSDGSLLCTMTVTAGEEVLLPEPPPEKAQWFKGWAREDGTFLSEGETVTADEVLTAVYEGLPETEQETESAQPESAEDAQTQPSPEGGDGAGSAGPLGWILGICAALAGAAAALWWFLIGKKKKKDEEEP